MDASEVKQKLLEYLDTHSLCVLKMPEDEWTSILSSFSGGAAYSWAAEHNAFHLFSKRSLSLTFGKEDGAFHAYLGIVNSKRAIATTQSRIKIIQNYEIAPSSPEEFLEVVNSDKLAKKFSTGKRSWGQSFNLSISLSKKIIEALLAIPENRPVLGSVEYHRALMIAAAA